MAETRFHRLKEVRLELGMRQNELARRLGVKPQVVAIWEKRADAKISTLLAWADALGVDPARLLVLPRKAQKKRKRK